MKEAETLINIKSSYFLRVLKGDYNPFTPDRIVVTEDFIEHKRRNWYLISVNKTKYHFKSFLGIDVRKSFFGADIIIEGFSGGEIKALGFTKKKANMVYTIVAAQISKYAIEQNKNTTNVFNQQLSVPDELKKLKQLYDEGILTQEEYNVQKKKLLSN